jgi:hypothetical protein
LADLGHTVVTSIHQPRSSIFAMFDDLLLLSEGAVVYSGPAEAAIDYFAGLGHACPEHYNPAEFLADLISIDFTSPEAEAETRARVGELAKAWEKAAGEQAHHREHIRRTASGLRALGPVRREPGIGWLRCVRSDVRDLINLLLLCCAIAGISTAQCCVGYIEMTLECAGHVSLLCRLLLLLLLMMMLRLWWLA